MKKLVALLLAMCLFVGCSSGGVSQSEYDKVVAENDALKAQIETSSDIDFATDENADKNISTENFDKKSVIEKIKVTEYNFVSVAKTSWTILVLENTSEFDLNIGIDVAFKDASDNLIGAKTDSQEAVQSGFVAVFTFLNDEKPTSIEYSLTAKQEEYFECVQSDLSYKVSNAKNKAIISVTNNGKQAAEFVEYNALFFQKGKLIGCDNGYAIDDDGKLQSGKTINSEADCFEEFDDVKVYLTGRR